MDSRTKQEVAIKVIDLEELNDEIEDIQQETMVLSQCHSPYIIQYYGSFIKVCLEAHTRRKIREGCQGGKSV